MPRPVAYKTGTIQPPNTAKQSNILVGVGPSNWGAGAANATFYNGLDSSYQYVIVKNSAVPAMWGTGDFTTSSLLTTINGLPERVGQTRFTDATTAISWSLASGNYTILKNEQPYGGPVTDGLILDFSPKVNNYFANGDFAYGTTIGWVDYGGSPFIYDITNDKPYVGSKSTKALGNIGGGFTWGRYTNPIYGPAGLLVVGNTYTFSFWAKIISGPNFAISWNNQNGSGETNAWTSGANITNTWTKVTQTFTYDAARLYFYIAGNYTGTTQYILTEFQLEDGPTANAFSSFPVTSAGWSIPNNGLLSSGSFSLTNGAYFNAGNNGNVFFDGIDDYVNSGYDLSWNNTNSISIEFWMNPATISGGNYGIMGKEYPNWEWAFYQYGTTLNLVYWNTAGGHTNGMDFSVNAFPTANTWYHVVYTWDGSTSIFYVNGVALGSRTATDPSINQNRSNNVMFGGHTYVWGDYYWNGKLGGVRFYNKKLSTNEVENLYTAGQPTYLPSQSIVNQGLALYLDASNPNSYPGSGATWNDLSGYGYNGTLTNGPTYNSGNGGSIVFDGVDDYVACGNLGTFNNMSFQMFVKVLSNSGTYRAFGGAIGAGNDYDTGFNIDMQGGSSAAFTNCSIEGGFLRVGGGTNFMTSSVSFGTWCNICFTVSPTFIQFYLNGVAQYGTTRLNNGSSTIGMNNLVLGARPYLLPNTSINANIGDTQIYNRALTPTEVLQNYNALKARYGL